MRKITLDFLRAFSLPVQHIDLVLKSFHELSHYLMRKGSLNDAIGNLDKIQEKDELLLSKTEAKTVINCLQSSSQVIYLSISKMCIKAMNILKHSLSILHTKTIILK